MSPSPPGASRPRYRSCRADPQAGSLTASASAGGRFRRAYRLARPEVSLKSLLSTFRGLGSAVPVKVGRDSRLAGPLGGCGFQKSPGTYPAPRLGGTLGLLVAN